MNKFTYNIFFISKNKSNKFIDKFNKKTITINSIKFDINAKLCSFEKLNLLENFPHAIVFDYFDKKHIKHIVSIDRQIEIYVLHNSKERITFKNVFIYKVSEFSPQRIIEHFYYRRFKTLLGDFIDTVNKNTKFRLASPGHNSGKNIKIYGIKNHYYKNIYKDDISISDICWQNELSHKNILLSLERKIANTYNSKHAFVCVQGTSTSNKIVILSLLKKGDKVLIDRNVHRSIIYAIILSGAIPVFFETNINKRFNIIMPANDNNVLDTLNKHKDAKLIILTNPTYEGINKDWSYIIKQCHNYGIKVFIDQAWGSHLYFHPDFYTSINSKADYITMSFHKTLFSLSMGSIILINDKDFKNIKNDFLENLNMFSTTSPFYPIMRSIENSLHIISINGRKLLSNTINNHIVLLKSMKNMKNIYPLNRDYLNNILNEKHIYTDYSRLTVYYNNRRISQKDIIKIFKAYSIVIEKINTNSFTLLISPYMSYNHINTIIKIFSIIDNTNKRTNVKPYILEYNNLNVSMSPQDAYFSKGKWININKAEGYIAANIIVPYPPGIPLIIPGQKIHKKTLEQLINVNKIKSIKLHGIIDNKIKVVCD